MVWTPPETDTYTPSNAQFVPPQTDEFTGPSVMDRTAPPKSKTESFLRGVQSGVTLNTAPYLNAAGSKIGQAMAPGPSETYAEALKRYQLEQQYAQQDNPSSYLGGSMVGSIPTYVGAGKVISKAMPNVSPLAQGAAINGSTGFVQGASNYIPGGSVTDHLMNGAVDSALGITTGAILHGAGKLAPSKQDMLYKTAPEAQQKFADAHSRTLGELQVKRDNLGVKDKMTDSQQNAAGVYDDILNKNQTSGGDYNSFFNSLNPVEKNVYNKTFRPTIARKEFANDVALKSQTTPITPVDVQKSLLAQQSQSTSRNLSAAEQGVALAGGLGGYLGMGPVGAGAAAIPFAYHYAKPMLQNRAVNGAISELNNTANPSRFMQLPNAPLANPVIAGGVDQFNNSEEPLTMAPTGSRLRDLLNQWYPQQ